MCNNCQNTTCYQCNQPPLCAPNDCSCPVKDLSTDCVLYTGNDLACSGIKSQTILTELIQQLDEFICTLVEQSLDALSLINIGTGANVYKGIDLQGRKEIRRINAVGDLITVTQNPNDISVSIDENELTDFIQEVLPPPPCFSSLDESVYINLLRNGCYDFSVIFRGIENIGGGAGFYKTFNPLTNNYQFKSLIVDSQSGDGTSILRDVQQNPNDVTVRLKKLKSDTLNITSINDEEISIEYPTTTSSVSFYVDVNSVSSTETGSIVNPFKTLNKALDEFIGTGTWFNPQFKGYKITLLSACNLLESPGIDYNGYINLDINNLNIEGNGFYLGLYTNPSPDYYPISTRRMVTAMPKTAGILNFDIDLRFNNIVFQRTGTNAIVDHLNYSFPTADINIPTFPPQQNGSRIWITNSTLTNDTASSGNFNVVPNPNDGGNPLLMFGVPVYASNTEPIGVPMVKSEGRSWNKEGEFRLGNSRLVNSKGTALKFVNTTYSDFYETNVIGTNNYYKFYETEVDNYYSPKLGFYMIDLEDVNYMALSNLKINWTQPRMTTTEVIPRSKIIGGVEALFKLVNSSLFISGESSDQDSVENLVQLDGNSYLGLDEYFSNGQINDNVHGVFKVTAPLPVLPTQLNIQNSVLYSVILDETGVDKSYVQQINGDKNRINNAPHSSYLQYVNDTAARAGGLIRGNTYYNTTVGALTTIF
jgi:hypothetical protein